MKYRHLVRMAFMIVFIIVFFSPCQNSVVKADEANEETDKKEKEARKDLKESRLLKKDIEKLLKKSKNNCDEKLLKDINKKILELDRLFMSLNNTAMIEGCFNDDEVSEIVNYFGYLQTVRFALTLKIGECAKKAILGIKHGQNKDVKVCEKNWCRDKADIPNDTYLYSKGSWKQKHDDQWAIKHIGSENQHGTLKTARQTL